MIVRQRAFGESTDVSAPIPSGNLAPLPKISPFWWALSAASAAASAYHGYKRNQSVGWAIAWGALGAVFPIITPAIAVAEGFGKRAR